MEKQAQRRALRLLPLGSAAVVSLVLLCLNLIPIGTGSIAFEEEHFSGFEPSRGWPFAWWTRANEEGVHSIDALVAQGDSRYYRDFFPSAAHPHLALNAATLIASAIVCLAIAATDYMLALIIMRRFVQKQATNT